MGTDVFVNVAGGGMVAVLVGLGGRLVVVGVKRPCASATEGVVSAFMIKANASMESIRPNKTGNGFDCFIRTHL